MVIYILIAVLILLIIVPIIRKIRKSKQDIDSLSKEIHQLQDSFNFLIDKQFHVKETNFYELNPDIKDDQPYVLGNVLHCQNGCDSGLCGTGLGCNTCPIRLVVNNSFKQRRDFQNITATMHIYDADHKPQELEVKVDGHLVYVGYEPHLVVNVSNSGSETKACPQKED